MKSENGDVVYYTQYAYGPSDKSLDSLSSQQGSIPLVTAFNQATTLLNPMAISWLQILRLMLQALYPQLLRPAVAGL